MIDIGDHEARLMGQPSSDGMIHHIDAPIEQLGNGQSTYEIPEPEFRDENQMEAYTSQPLN